MASTQRQLLVCASAVGQFTCAEKSLQPGRTAAKTGIFSNKVLCSLMQFPCEVWNRSGAGCCGKPVDLGAR